MEVYDEVGRWKFEQCINYEELARNNLPAFALEEISIGGEEDGTDVQWCWSH